MHLNLLKEGHVAWTNNCYCIHETIIVCCSISFAILQDLVLAFRFSLHLDEDVQKWHWNLPLTLNLLKSECIKSILLSPNRFINSHLIWQRRFGNFITTLRNTLIKITNKKMLNKSINQSSSVLLITADLLILLI